MTFSASALGTMTDSSPSTLQIFVDLGSSLTKVLYLDRKGNPAYLVMPPTVAVGISLQSIHDYLLINQSLPPSDTAWLELPDEDGAIAVGSLADNYRGQSALSQQKALSGLYRVMAVLGVLREVMDLPTELTCDLGVALPVAEYATRDLLEKRLRSSAHFSCRGTSISMQFRLIDCQPEGYGLVRECRAEMLKAGSNQKSRIAAVIMGHRNLSMLLFSGSSLQLNECRSDGAGFVMAIETAARMAGIEPTSHGLLDVVAGNQALLRVRGAGIKPIDVSGSVRAGRAAYWSSVKQYLESNLPGGDYRLIIGGGAAWAMKTELSTWLQENGLVASFCESIQRRMAGVLKLSSPGFKAELLSAENELFSLQLADAFVGFSALLTKARKLFQ